MQAAQKADADGTNFHHPPSNEWFARACRTSRDSIPRFYRAAEAAGLMVLLYGPSGTRVRGYACVLPLGAAPGWAAALAVLREDPRRVRQAALRAGTAAQHPRKSARTDFPSPDGPHGANAVRADLSGAGRRENNAARAASDDSAGAGGQVRRCGHNQEVTYQERKMAGVVGTVTTSRARALLHGEGVAERPAAPVRPESQEPASEPRHRDRTPGAPVPVGRVPAPRPQPDRAPAAPPGAAPAAAAPPAAAAGPVPADPGRPEAWPQLPDDAVIRPGTPGWEGVRAAMRATRERLRPSGPRPGRRG
jgi:hypothetical protein